MKKTTLAILTALALALIPSLSTAVLAARHGAGTADGDHSAHGTMDHSAHQGELIHESMVDGYRIAYHAIDMQKQMAGMENAPKMANTHHLMVHVQTADGKPVENGQVGYLIEGPDGKAHQVMCMAMSGGYGADVNFGAPGAYKVKMKLVSGDAKLMDGFTHEVK